MIITHDSMSPGRNIWSDATIKSIFNATFSDWRLQECESIRCRHKTMLGRKCLSLKMMCIVFLSTFLPSRLILPTKKILNIGHVTRIFLTSGVI